MKKKPLKFIKKTLKKHLLSLTLTNSPFLIIQLKTIVDLLFFETKNKKVLIDSFSKQVSNIVTFLNPDILKFPNVLISVLNAKDILDYCSSLIKQKKLPSIFILKIYFMFFKTFKNILSFIFNNLLQLNLIFFFFLTNPFNQNIKIKSHKIVFPAFIECKLNFI